MGEMVVLLWHPDSPGTRLLVRPGILRRLGIIRSQFATLSEAINNEVSDAGYGTTNDGMGAGAVPLER